MESPAGVLMFNAICGCSSPPSWYQNGFDHLVSLKALHHTAPLSIICIDHYKPYHGSYFTADLKDFALEEWKGSDPNHSTSDR
jgi:hypothetical protein